MITFELLSQEDLDAYESLPETIEWRAYQKRADANARPHCTGCGRFMKKSTLRQDSDKQPTGYCANCNHRMDATWERS